MGAGIVASSHIGKVPPALPSIQADLGVDLVTAGWIASIVSATSFALGLVAGSIADRFGQRRVVLFGIMALAAGSLLGSFAPTGGMLLAARFIEGLGFAATTISAAAIIAQVTHAKDRKWVLGCWAAYFPMGVISFLLLSPVIVDGFGWRILWQVSCAVTVLWLAVFWRATADWSPESSDGGKSETLFRNVTLTLAQRGAVLAAACFALYAAQHVAFIVWLPTMIMDAWAASTFVAAAVPTAVLFFNIGGVYLAGWVMSRGAPIWLLMAVGGAGMGLAELGFYSNALPDMARLAMALMFGVFGGLVPAAALAAAPVYAPSPAQIGTINGLLVMGTNTGQLFGPPALAAVRETVGSWVGTLWLMLSLAAAIILLALLSRPMERKAELGIKSQERPTRIR
jgi:MFS family permease